MPIWLLLLLGGGGYIVVRKLLAPEYPEGLESPASQAIFDLLRGTIEKWREGVLGDDALETQIEIVSERQRDLREAGQMTQAEYNILNQHKAAVLGAAGLI